MDTVIESMHRLQREGCLSNDVLDEIDGTMLSAQGHDGQGMWPKELLCALHMLSQYLPIRYGQWASQGRRNALTEALLSSVQFRCEVVLWRGACLSAENTTPLIDLGQVLRQCGRIRQTGRLDHVFLQAYRGDLARLRSAWNGTGFGVAEYAVLRLAAWGVDWLLNKEVESAAIPSHSGDRVADAELIRSLLTAKWGEHEDACWLVNTWLACCGVDRDVFGFPKVGSRRSVALDRSLRQATEPLLLELMQPIGERLLPSGE